MNLSDTHQIRDAHTHAPVELEYVPAVQAVQIKDPANRKRNQAGQSVFWANAKCLHKQ